MLSWKTQVERDWCHALIHESGHAIMAAIQAIRCYGIFLKQTKIVTDVELIRKVSDTENNLLQKSISKEILEAWPPIYFVTHILNKNGLEFVAVVIYGSPLRPHFSGSAYVRVGPETRDASEEEYDKLIAQRSSKVRALQKLVGKTVYWESHSPLAGNANGTVVDCNQFFVTIDGGTYQRCFPVDWITISFDPSNQRYCLIAKG